MANDVRVHSTQDQIIREELTTMSVTGNLKISLVLNTFRYRDGIMVKDNDRITGLNTVALINLFQAHPIGNGKPVTDVIAAN